MSVPASPPPQLVYLENLPQPPPGGRRAARQNVVVFDVDTSALPPGQDMPVYFRGVPFELIRADAWLVLKNAWKIPLIFYPFPKVGTDTSISGVIQQVVATAVSLILTIAVFASAVTPIAGITILAIWAFLAILTAMQGPPEVVSKHVDGQERFDDEEWFFVNGIATNGEGTQLAANRLAELFGRHVTGICNRTNGIWFDLVQCLIQRDLLWPTADVRIGYEYLSAAIRKDSTKRIVLFAHSQGGIIASIWADQLLADFSPAQLRQVEIYTFASASNHFSAPTAPKMSSPFGNIEHFANELDFVSDIDWKRVKELPHPDPLQVPVFGGRFAGRVFVREGYTGHLLLSHYLNPDCSILDSVAAIDFSHLQSYLDGRGAVVEPDQSLVVDLAESGEKIEATEDAAPKTEVPLDSIQEGSDESDGSGKGGPSQSSDSIGGASSSTRKTEGEEGTPE